MVRALSFGTALVLFVIGCGGASSSGDPNFDAVAEKARTGDKDGALRMVLSYGGGPARWRSFETQSDSMGPTIEGGDRFLVQSIDYTKTHPRRGEVVAFIPTSAQRAACLSSPSTIYVKRVVGIAGDRVTVTRGSPAVVNGTSERSVGRRPTMTRTSPSYRMATSWSSGTTDRRAATLTSGNAPGIRPPRSSSSPNSSGVSRWFTLHPTAPIACVRP